MLKLKQLTEMLLSREEEKGLIVKDPFMDPVYLLTCILANF